MRLVIEEQRLADDGLHSLGTERLVDEERRLWPATGQQTFGICRDEDYRHIERLQDLVDGLEA